MGTLQRCTTEYVECEDRIRLAGELASGATVVLWLTQRLMNRLAPHLTAWLARQQAPVSRLPAVQAAHQDIVQGFAQQAAQAQLAQRAPAPPVRACAPEASWRVHAIDIAQGEDAVALTFKAETGAHATFTLAAQPLRQWLGIVYAQYLRGQWPTTAWPAWMDPRTASQTAVGHAQLLH